MKTFWLASCWTFCQLFMLILVTCLGTLGRCVSICTFILLLLQLVKLTKIKDKNKHNLQVAVRVFHSFFYTKESLDSVKYIFWLRTNFGRVCSALKGTERTSSFNAPQLTHLCKEINTTADHTINSHTLCQTWQTMGGQYYWCNGTFSVNLISSLTIHVQCRVVQSLVFICEVQPPSPPPVLCRNKLF